MKNISYLVNNKVDYDALMVELDDLGLRWTSHQTPTKFDALGDKESVVIILRVGERFRGLSYTESNPLIHTPKLFQKGDVVMIKEDKNSNLMNKIQEMEDRLAELKQEAVNGFKKEQKYIVILPDPNSTTITTLRKGEFGVAFYTVPRFVYSETSSSNHLTESEIKANHEWAWRFAKEVD